MNELNTHSGGEVWDWLKSILIAMVAVLVIHQFVFHLSTVKGHSMQPTLQQGEWLFIDRLVFYLDEPRTGQVIILKDPSDTINKQFLVKRIIGVPGDTIEVRSRALYVNGKKTVESYTNVEIEDGDYGPAVVPPKQYFVMGDNRHLNASKDSRMFGTVPRNEIEGRVDFIVWPITRMNRL